MNLLLLLFIFYLSTGTWIFVRNLFQINDIWNSSGRNFNSDMTPTKLLWDVFDHMVIGVLLALLGALILIFSNTAIDGSPEVNILLIILFSTSVFFATYLITYIYSSENIEVGRTDELERAQYMEE